MGCRAERPSAKKLDASRGSYLGWSYMACRNSQPELKIRRRARLPQSHLAPLCKAMCLVLNLGYLLRIQAFEEAPGLGRIKLGILGFDAEKETILARPLKIWGIEDWMVGCG